MKKNISLGLVLVMMMSLMVFASCAKKAPESEETPMGITTGTGEGAEAESEAERQRRIAEEEIAEDRARQAEEEKAKFLDTKIYFAFDDSSLSAEARETLLAQARWLKENRGRTVVVEGHCDNRGTEEYNLALGSRRAQSVKDFLVNAGVELSQIVTISYGEEKPAVRGDNEEAWAKNRRAEFRLR